MDLLRPITESGMGDLVWYNPPQGWECLADGGLRIHVHPRTDFFQNPNRQGGRDSACYLWVPVAGDFVARTHVRPKFASTYDAGALLVRSNETHWVKICFERTDFGTTAIVSVVTDGLSDDANGADITAPDVWLQIVRVGDLFGLHYALDGASWRMVRYFALPLPPSTQIGLVAQSPVGPGTSVDFLSFSLELRTVADLRAGV
jgi:regulation of enolase protein 1 (concanavalin A-like superfamily)